MDFIDAPDDNNTDYRYITYNGKILRSQKDKFSGGYGTYTQFLLKSKINKLKYIYGNNGDLTNTNAVSY